MNLERVVIKNFRSIPHADVLMHPRGQILLGINEAGKSNFLSALRLIDPIESPQKNDIRQATNDEDEIKEAFVDFYFKFEMGESRAIFDRLKKLFPVNADSPILEINNETFTIDEICTRFNSIVIRCDLISETKFAVSTLTQNKAMIFGEWSIVEKYGAGTIISLLSNREIQLEDNVFLPSREIASEFLTLFRSAEIQDIMHQLDETKYIIFLVACPTTIWWKYSDDQHLPSKVSIAKFIEDPEISIPLLRLFQLGGVYEPSKELAKWLDGNEGTLENSLDRVADRASDAFQAMWPDHNNIRFVLRDNNGSISVFVKNINRYPFKDRSEGFKRFLTFLLVISTAVKHVPNFKNSLILIDEPDVSLHPKASRSLRDLILSMADYNCVVYSTHSIFMVDPTCIERHLLFKRVKERTMITRAEKSDLMDEEILYQSLGYSALETLRQNNILFEGWRDKAIFEKALNSVNVNIELRNFFLAFGLSHAKGVKSIRPLVPLFEMASRSLIIVSDADAEARSRQREFEKLRCYGIWFRYDQILPNNSIVTTEDFLDKTYLFNCATNVLSIIVLGTPIKQEDFLQPGAIHNLKTYLHKQSISGDDLDKILNDFKDNVVNNITDEVFLPSYYEFLSALKRKIES